jgi:hypothetical protein
MARLNLNCCGICSQQSLPNAKLFSCDLQQAINLLYGSDVSLAEAGPTS